MSKKQVKTQRKVRRRLNVKRAFLLALIICLIVLICRELLKVDINNIEVVGNEYVSDSKIIKLAKLNNSTSYFGINKKETCKRITKNSLIHSCKIKHESNFKIKIEVVENKPLFYYQNANKLVLSNNTQIDEPNTYGVPTLINYVPEKILEKFISGLSDISSDIIRSVSEIEYTPSSNSDGTYIDEERFMLMMNDGNIVYINNRNISVLSNYDKIYASIGDRKGYFNFDSDFSNYFFKEFEE